MTPLHKLISVADIQVYRAISENIPLERIEPYITEAQDLDFRGLIGEDFYNVLFTEVVPPTFPVTYKYAELKPQYSGYLAYMAYARFLLQNQVTSTSNSIVRKTNDFSEPISDATLSKIISNARAAGSEYGKRFIDYMNKNAEDYPEWKDSDCYKRNVSSNMKGVARLKSIKGKRSQWLW